MKVLKNFAYTSGYQLFAIIVPIITTPYISRRLGPAGMGINAFSLSLVQVFVLFAYLGTQKYGNNVIAKSRSNPALLVENFKSIYLNQLLTTTLALIAYFGYILLFIRQNQHLYLIQGIYLVTVYFDVSWFFQGKEDFKTTVIRGMGSKLLGMVLIFALVKSKQDTNLYALILAVSNLGANMIMWIYLWREINWHEFVKLRLQLKVFINQLKAIFTFFIPVAFLQITTLMYQLILGWHTNETQVAYYSNATKIITIPLYIITSFVTVMFPRMSYEVSQKNGHRAVDLLQRAVKLTLLLAVPLMFGMIAVSPNFVRWFFGKDFLPVSPIMIILSFQIIPRTLNETFGYLYLMANGKVTLYSRALSIGGAFSLALNFIVTFFAGAAATALVSVIAEVIILIVILFFSRAQISTLLSGFNLRIMLYAIIMFLLVSQVSQFINHDILTTLLQVVIGIIVYGGLIFVFERKNVRELLRGLQIEKEN